MIEVRQGIEQVDANWADQNQKQPPITLMILLTTLTIILDTIIGVTHRLENDNDNYDDYFGVCLTYSKRVVSNFDVFFWLFKPFLTLFRPPK